MRKAEILNHWKSIPENQEVAIDSIPYKHSGSTYAQDGIRITGSQVFIDSILSHLKDILKHENGTTRLGLNYQESIDRETKQPTGSYSCYIQVHERGSEAQIMNAIIDNVRAKRNKPEPVNV